jgi:hypothetical protein
MPTANQTPANILKLARPGGFEPPTHSLEEGRFINYINVIFAQLLYAVAYWLATFEMICNGFRGRAMG